MRTRLSIILLLVTVLLAGVPVAHAATRPHRDGRRVELVARARQAQRARMVAVAKAITEEPPALTDPASFVRPANAPITSGFGRRWGRPHTGVDIDAPYGARIVAAQAGVVTLAGWKNGYGRTVIIDHGNGVSTLYGHQSRLAVRAGQHVAQGDYIGNVGATGHVTAPHLHYEVLVGGVPRNPMPWLQRQS